MSERTQLVNGRFEHDLDSWTVSGAVYSAGDGDEHYGVAVLSTGGDYLEQTFSVPQLRAYTLHLAAKPVGAQLSAGQATVRIQDGDGNTVVTKDIAGDTADQWRENEWKIGLAPGTTYTLRLTNVSAAGDLRLDDAWLWFVPLAKADLIDHVHTKLGRLASERSLSVADAIYDNAYLAGLRAVGAINPETGLPDVRYLDEESLQTALDAIEREMLEYLHREYAVETDIQVGPRRESRSQIARALEKLTGAGGEGASGQGRVVTRKLHHEREDYDWR